MRIGVSDAIVIPVRRDPRDISVVFFYDPELKQYFNIPYRETSRPAISLWEWREAQRRLKEQGNFKPDEEIISKPCLCF